MIAIGRWHFDPASRRLLSGQDERRLSPKAAGVLRALAETPGQIWSRDALLERVWPGVFVCEEVLTHAIAELRKSLGDDFRSPHFVETVHKGGYRLKCRVEDLAAGAAGAERDLRTGLDLGAYLAHLEACDLLEHGGHDDATADLFASALAFLAVYRGPKSAAPGRARTAAARKSDPHSAEAYLAIYVLDRSGNARTGPESAPDAPSAGCSCRVRPKRDESPSDFSLFD